MKLTHIDLFSGIGGFALAAQWAGFETVVFCENDEYCQKVIKKHWPAVPITPDIRDFDGTKRRGATLITAGPPCQPISKAGNRAGARDDRWLWPEALRIINEALPRWAVLENPPGIESMGLENIIIGLENFGYEVRIVDIPACAVGAYHIRQRDWILANLDGEWKLQPKGREQEQRGRPIDSIKKISSNPCGSRLPMRSQAGKNKKNARYFQKGDRPTDNPPEYLPRIDGPHQPLLGRGVHGISNRVDRIRALGNSIVPQVAHELIKGIAEIEKGNKK